MKKAVIEWHDNVPVTVSRETFPTGQITTVTEAVMAEPFDDPLSIWPQYEGLSNGEVLIRQMVRQAAFGDKDARKELFDRLIGKPKQQIESKTLSLSYKDYLDELDRTTVNTPQTPTE